jgi:hypothetical protein
MRSAAESEVHDRRACVGPGSAVHREERCTASGTRVYGFVRKGNLDGRPRQNDPTGKSLKNLSSPFEKNIPLTPSGKSVL